MEEEVMGPKTVAVEFRAESAHVSATWFPRATPRVQQARSRATSIIGVLI